MIAVSSSARSCGSRTGSPPSREPATGPIGPHSMIRVPAVAAPFVASGTKSGHTKASLAPESVKKKSISPALSSGFIGTTMPPARRMPQ